MNKWLSKILRWACGGWLYGLLEILWRGNTHWSMILLATILCIPLDVANDHIPWEMPLWFQAVIGGFTITAAEFVAGVVLNCWLGLAVWDYSALWGNVLGQVCPQFTLLWCVLACPVIVGFDWIDYWTNGGEKPHYRLV